MVCISSWLLWAGNVLVVLMFVCLSMPGIRLREPEFDPVPGRVTHKRGEKARLYCSVKHLGERTVIWRKVPDTNPLTIGTTTWVDNSRISVGHTNSDSQWDLIIEDVTSLDAGEYECQISISKKLLRHVVELYVTENSGGQAKRNPDIFISGTQFVSRGDNISLYCNASRAGNPHRLLAWFKGSQEMIQDEDRVIIRYINSYDIRDLLSSNLLIQGAQADDSGLYTCRSRDEKLMTSAHVTVLTGGSNNVKRAGPSSSTQESGAVIRFQSAISHSTLIPLMLFLYYNAT